MEKLIGVFCCIVALSMSTVLFAQPEKAQTEVINGKKYYIHFVQSGNTLYGIHKLYQVPIEAIVQANPGVEKGLQDGQRILVPVPGSAGLETNLVLHTVEPKETLYAVAKKYNTSTEELIRLNPELEQGLKAGQQIKVPVPSEVANGSGQPFETVKVRFTDTLVMHNVQKGETLYSLSKRYMVTEQEILNTNDLRQNKIRPGDVLKIPLKKEVVEKVAVRPVPEKTEKGKREKYTLDSTLLFKKKANYQFSLLLPLYLKDTSGSKYEVSKMATEFYMGAQLAFEVLEEKGLKAKVYVADTENDSVTIAKELSKISATGIDFVIGPFYGAYADEVADFCGQRSIRMYSPFSTNASIIQGNPYVYESVTSDLTSARMLAQYLVNKKVKNVLLIKSGSEKDLVLHAAFVESLKSASKDKIKVLEIGKDDYMPFVSDYEVAVFLTESQNAEKSFLNTLNKNAGKLKSSSIVFYTNSKYDSQSVLASKALEELKLIFVSPFNFDYQNEAYKEIHKKYRSKYNADMSKMACQGYDLVMHIASTNCFQKSPEALCMNSFNFKQLGEGNGFENHSLFFFQYSDFYFNKIDEFRP